ncbi:unnamed protein product, partial [Hapterophycus canaliculatus]
LRGSSQQIAWWTPEEGSDELRLLFAAEDELEDSMAEKLKEDPFPDETDRASSEMESIEPSDDGLDEEQEETKKSTEDANRLNERLSALRKPAWSLTLVPTPTNDEELEYKEPANRAAAFLSDQSPQLVEGSFHPIPRAYRVHVPFCHRPTYFQEMNLERCGKLDCERYGCLQNAYSSVWFLANAALLPHRIGSQSPCQCVRIYGDCLTCQRYDSPIEPICDKKTDANDCRGMLLQAASMAGFAFLVW